MKKLDTEQGSESDPFGGREYRKESLTLLAPYLIGSVSDRDAGFSQNFRTCVLMQ